MKIKFVYTLLLSLLLCGLSYSQDADVEKLLKKGDFDNTMLYIRNEYKEDTLKIDRYIDLYLYYSNKDNPQRDSVKALYFASKYCELEPQGKKIAFPSFAKSTLSAIYPRKDVDMLNCYISIIGLAMPELVSEAERIRDKYAFEQVVLSGDLDKYEEFVNKYPGAIQADQARQYLNEHRMKELLQSKDLEKLRNFAKTTSNPTYKKQAMEEMDKLSFQQALQENTMEAYDQYIKEFPQGEYILMAQSKRENAQYNKYVNEGTISDMMYFLRTSPTQSSNYRLVVDRLKLKCLTQYSLDAMKLIDSIDHNETFLRAFAKRYVADLSTASIERLTTAFGSLKDADYILEASKKARSLATLKAKSKLTLEDYKKNKSLFGSLASREASLVFASFEALNEGLPKNKAINFGLGTYADYQNYRFAKRTELDFVLTDAPADIKEKSKAVDLNSLGIGLKSEDATMSNDGKVVVFSSCTQDGFDYYPSSKNRDIYFSVFKDGKWQTPEILSYNINTRFDECKPVLSSDKKTLWFSSDRGLNFGKRDVYFSYREDINDWNSWSVPILLGEDINTEDNDYVVAVYDKMLVLSQEDNHNSDNNIYLEGNTKLNIVCGKIGSTHNDYSGTKIHIFNKKDFSLINIIRPNNSGNFAFLKPGADFALYVEKNNFYSPICDSLTPKMYSIDELASNNELITISSLFNSKNPLELTKKGQTELGNLASVFKNKPYILTLDIHSNISFKKYDEVELSSKQADVVREFLVKKGMPETKVLVNGLGQEKVVQGWENKDCMDIGVINK